MKLRQTLTETLMEEETTGHATTLYDKTATAYMFGYACSSGFGSGSGFKGGSNFGSALSFGMGGGGIAKLIPETPLIERYRFDDSHSLPHINLEIGLMTSGKSIPLLTKHTKLKIW